MAGDWFLSIDRKKHEESLGFLDKDFIFWGKSYKEEEYIKLISAIESISLAENEGGEEEPFIVLGGGEPQIIKAHVIVKVRIAENFKETIPSLTEGINSLEIGFSYNSMTKNWLILYIDTTVI